MLADLTHQQRHDVFAAANACLEAADMTGYDDAFMCVVPGADAKPQVLVMPMRSGRVQGNTFRHDEGMRVYSTAVH